MKKEEVRQILLTKVLSNRQGVSVHLTPTTLAAGSKVRNWLGEIQLPHNAPVPERLWFAYVDHSPNANFEHPVDYVFVDDQNGETWVVHGTTPPDNLSTLETIAGGVP